MNIQEKIILAYDDYVRNIGLTPNVLEMGKDAYKDLCSHFHLMDLTTFYGMTINVNEYLQVDRFYTMWGESAGISTLPKMKEKVCECGASKVNSSIHSNWCDLA